MTSGNTEHVDGTRLSIERIDVALFALPAGSLAPLVWLEGMQLWDRPHMQFFPLAFAFAFWLYANEDRHVGGGDWLHGLVARIFYVAALGLTLLGHAFYSPWLAHVAIVLWIVSWTSWRLPWISVRRQCGILALMLITVPAPLNLDSYLVQGLQMVSSTLCSRLLDVIGIVHVRLGNTLEIAEKQLFVAEACSGIDSLYSLSAIGVMYLLWTRTTLLPSLVVVVLAPFWAMLGNLFRIFSIVVFIEYVGIDLSQGWVHTVLGLIVFSVSTIGLIGAIQIVRWVVPMRRSDSIGGMSVRSETGNVSALPASTEDRRVSRWVWGMIGGLDVVVVLLAILSTLSMLSHLQRSPLTLPKLTDEMIAMFPAEEDLPSVSGGLSRLGFSTDKRERANLMGQCSRMWRYSSAVNQSVASLDFPFRGWHPLEVCYASAGWNVDSIEYIESDQDPSRSWPIVELKLSRQSQEFALIDYSLFDTEGKPFRFDPSIGSSAVNRLTGRFSAAIQAFLKPPDPITMQFQVMTYFDTPIQPEQIQRQREQYLSLRATVLRSSESTLEKVRGLW